MNRHFLGRVGWFVVTAALACSARAADKNDLSSGAKLKLVSLDYANAEVSEVIRALTAQSGVNVALNPNVKGKITVHLRDKSVHEAIVVVANLSGLGARRVGDTYVIAPTKEMRQTLERVGTTRQIKLAYLPGKEAADLVEAAFADLTARPHSTGVTLVGCTDDLEAGAKLLLDNDIQNPDLIRSTERVPVRHRPAKLLATTLSKMVTGLNVEAAGETVVLVGTKKNVDNGLRTLELIDVETRPDVETRVYNVKYAAPVQLINLLEKVAPDVEAFTGIESNMLPKPVFEPLSGQFVGAGPSGADGGGSGGQAGGSAASQALSPALSGGATGAAKGVNPRALTLVLRGAPGALDAAMSLLKTIDVAPKQMLIEARVVDSSPEFTKNLGVEWEWNQFQFVERPGLSGGGSVPGGSGLPLGPLGFGSFGRVQFNPLATLNAMVTNRQAKLLASPKVVVINDQDASIFIGDTLRFQSLAQSSPTTGNQFTVVEVPVGIVLLVRPRVNDDGIITLRVHPVISTVTGFVGGLPQTSAREAETTVRVKDGDTFVIGGLIRDEDIKQFSKVPILGDLPLIGQLFKNEYRNHRRSEVMVFITIRMLQD